jgi:hypothetical protein
MSKRGTHSCLSHNRFFWPLLVFLFGKNVLLDQFSGCCRGSYAPVGSTESLISLFLLYSPSVGSFDCSSRDGFAIPLPAMWCVVF